jgi:sensor histidine kinase YesM
LADHINEKEEFMEYVVNRGVFLFLIISLFYLQYYSLKHLLNSNTRLTKIVIILLVGFILYYVFFELVVNFIILRSQKNWVYQAFSDLYFLLTFVAGASLYYFIKDFVITKRKLMNLEIQFLRNQVKPHYFNNELSNLLALVSKGEIEKSQVYIKELSQYITYNLKCDMNKPNLLKEELNSIFGYLDNIEQSNEGNIRIYYTLEGSTKKIKIYPLLLTTFIENAVKHSALTINQEGFIDLTIKIDRNILFFELTNSISLDKSNTIPSTKIGLKNVKKRLAIQYQDRYDLTIRKSEQEFYVYLKIELDE